MNIDDLTIKEARQICSIFGNQDPEPTTHPLNGQRVIAVLPNGFVHFGTLNQQCHGYTLTDASNIRYWEKRDGGLPAFAQTGPKDGDKIDIIGSVHIETVLFFYPCGEWL